MKKGNLPQRAVGVSMAAVMLLAPLSLVGCAAADDAGDAPAQQGAPAEQEAAEQGSDQKKEVSSMANKGLSFADIPSTAVLTPQAASEMAAATPGLVFLDIQNRADYSRARLNNAKNIPAGTQIDARLNELPADKPIVIYDKDGTREPEVWQTLVDAGFDSANLYVLEGGRDGWIAEGLPYDDTVIELKC